MGYYRAVVDFDGVEREVSLHKIEKLA